MNNKYSHDSIVSCYMSDCHYLLRPESFLDLAQQMAVKAAQVQSFNDNALKSHGCAWILARMQVRFEREVRFDENIHTWTPGTGAWTGYTSSATTSSRIRKAGSPSTPRAHG